MLVTTIEQLDALIKKIKRLNENTQVQVDKIFHAAAIAASAMRIPLAKAAVAESGMGIPGDTHFYDGRQS